MKVTSNRPNAKLKNLPEAVQDELWLLRQPVDGSRPKTYAECLAWLKSQHGVETNHASFCYWQRAYRQLLDKRQEEDDLAAAIVKARSLCPDMSAADLHDLAHRLFLTKAIASGNTEAFCRVELAHDSRRKTDLLLGNARNAALNELGEEVRVCPEAERHCMAMKSALEAWEAAKGNTA